MTYHSILFKRHEEDWHPEKAREPAFFHDLNLDQVVEAITAHKQEYNLKPFFYRTLGSAEAIHYRHEVLQDLERPALFEHVISFARELQEMRRRLAQMEELYYGLQKQAYFLDAVHIYGKAVYDLERNLSNMDLRSHGFITLRSYLTGYVASDRFVSLSSQTEALKTDLASIQYNIQIHGNMLKVLRYDGEDDYSLEVQAIFEKFRQGAVKDYRQEFNTRMGMNHVEAKILEFVAQLYPDIFQRLEKYCARNAAYLDDTIATFDREVQFYVAYMQHTRAFERAGLTFCYPQITQHDKEVHADEGFDLALAHKLAQEDSPVVCNDFFLNNPERIIVVSGPNQGGKTTFARMFGQLHYLANLGLPVPGRQASLFLFDNLFTHFEREEDITDLRGKLQDDLVRIHDILEQATPDSIIIINEIFTSTTSRDATFLGKEIMARIIDLDALCVCVTFIDELASLSEKTISMVSTVVPEDPAVRTYKIGRRMADGLAYALSIAEKHKLTYKQIKERMRS